MAASTGLDAPSQLLELLAAKSGEGGEPPLEDMLSTLQTLQAAGPPVAGGPLPDDRLEVFPEPGFVVKTSNEQGQKVFLNVCGTSKLPLPPGWTPGQVPDEVKRHLEEARGGDAPPCMRILLSVGPPRLDHDHRGEVCMVADCIVSSQLLALCPEYRPLKLFVIQLALGTAAQMTGQQLSPQYKLPKMRYKGNALPPQRIRAPGAAAPAQRPSGGADGGKAKPLIAEVADEREAPAFALVANKRQLRQRQAAAAAKPGPAAAADAGSGEGEAQQAAVQPPASQGQEGLAQPGSLLRLHAAVEYQGRPADFVRVTVALPPAVATTAQRDPRAIAASVCGEAVRVQAPGCQPLELQLPFAVRSTGGAAQLVPAGGGKAGGSLVLTLAYRPFASVLGELRQAAAAADGAALPGSPRSRDMNELD